MYRQQFDIAIQAAIGQKPIARENVKALKKDVTEGLYGGHFDRKLKQINKQKAGKKKLRGLSAKFDTKSMISAIFKQ